MSISTPPGFYTTPGYPTSGPKSTRFSKFPLTTGSAIEVQELLFDAQSIEILNNTPNAVLIAGQAVFQDAATILNNYDVLIPPFFWVVDRLQCNALTIQRTAPAKTAVTPTMSTIITVSEQPRETAYIALPQGSAQRPVQAVEDATTFYLSQQLALVQNTNYDVFNVNVPPPNQVMGVDVYNHVSSPDILTLHISGDGTYTNLTPTSGYTDQGNQNIPIWPGQPYSTNILIPTTGGVRLSTPATVGTYACGFVVRGF